MKKLLILLISLGLLSCANEAPKNYDDIKSADAERFGRFFSALIDEGVDIDADGRIVGLF